LDAELVGGVNPSSLERVTVDTVVVAVLTGGRETESGVGSVSTWVLSRADRPLDERLPDSEATSKPPREGGWKVSDDDTRE
jgi:hypothetical protein